MVRQSIMIVALLNKFVYEHRGNNTYVIQEKTALIIMTLITQIPIWAGLDVLVLDKFSKMAPTIHTI